MQNYQNMANRIKTLLNKLSRLKGNLHGNDFLLTWEKSNKELHKIMLTAELLMELYARNISTRCFKSGLAVSNFRDNSTRTRFSFASAANLLGLAVHDLDETKSQISHGETVRETANMISFLSEFIGIRDDMYLGAGDKYQREVGNALSEGFASKVLLQRPGVINLQSDLDHPTQSLADLMHVRKHFGALKNLKGKKIAMTWAYSPSYGKPLSVPQGIISLFTRYGMDVDLAYPEGYELHPDIVKLSMDEAFADADIVYPKSWAPYHIMEKRTKLLYAKDLKGLDDLEKVCLEQNAKFQSWECTEEKMKLTKQGNALYLHCLPADITGVSCEKGEVSEAIFNKYKTLLYKQAGYKPYVIASMMMNYKFKSPEKVLNELAQNACRRVIGE